MTERRWRLLALWVAIVLGTVALFWIRPAASPPAKGLPVTAQPAPPRPGGETSALPALPAILAPDAPTTSDVTPATERELEGESRVADDLNAAGGTLQRDLSLLEEVFSMWQTNFPRTGNPVGENTEITAALTGDNPAKFAFIPRRHRAINPAGELCDRWGTPFRFHQISGRQMEIRSAGPDRKFGTLDDAATGSPE